MSSYRVLFLCTGNCCRSQIAEAILKHLGGERFEPASAGCRPAGYIHPLAIDALYSLGIEPIDQYSKSWDIYADQEFDLVFTVSQTAAKNCPHWPGAPAVIHWPMPDPVFAPGTDEDRLRLAVLVGRMLRQQIEQMIQLPLERMDRRQWQAALARIGQV